MDQDDEWTFAHLGNAHVDAIGLDESQRGLFSRFVCLRLRVNTLQRKETQHKSAQERSPSEKMCSVHEDLRNPKNGYQSL
jgi:hypothetical protein